MVAKKAESKDIAICLQKHKGNQSRVAKELGVTRKAIQQRIRTDPIVRSAWERYKAALEKVVPHRKSIRLIAEAMEAEKEHRNMSGEVVDTSPDHKIRLAANEQYLKINRLISDDTDKKAAEQHLHLHLGDKKTSDLLAEIKSQLKFLGHDPDAEASTPTIEPV